MSIRTVIRKWHPFTWLSITVGCIAVFYVLARAVHGEVARRRDEAHRCRVLLTEIAKAKVLYAELSNSSDDVVMPWGFLGEASRHYNFDSKYWPCRAEGKVSIGRLSMPVRCERHGAIQQNRPERDMLGWPIREVTPAERKRNLARALAALRQATAEHETKVAELRERLGSATDPEAAAAELAHQEKILAALRERLEEKENAKRVGGSD